MKNPELKNIKKFSWNSKFETGIKRIDFEHEVFLDLINCLKFAIENKIDDEQINGLIMEIEKYAEFHFVSEENFMKRIKYPHLEEHRSIHLDLLEDFNIAKHKVKNHNELIKFLYDWFINHTIAEDGRIKDFIEENDIDPSCQTFTFIHK